MALDGKHFYFRSRASSALSDAMQITKSPANRSAAIELPGSHSRHPLAVAMEARNVRIWMVSEAKFSASRGRFVHCSHLVRRSAETMDHPTSSQYHHTRAPLCDVCRAPIHAVQPAATLTLGKAGTAALCAS